MDRRQKIICIEGIIGAGKSTLIRELKRDFTCFEEPVDTWTLLPYFYSDMKRYSVPFELQVLVSYHDQYTSFKNIIVDNNNDINNNNDEAIIIVERCPWSSKNVFTQMLIDDGMFDTACIETYNKLYDILSYEVDFYIYLDVDTESALERIRERNRHEESKITLQYLERLREQYEKSFSPLQNVYYVNANVDDAKEVEQRARSLLCTF